jgi:hypothetical protein
MTPPAAGAAAAAPGVRRGRVAAPPRPRVSPPRPRRVSGPARPSARPPVRRPTQPAGQQAAGERGLILGLLALGRGVSEHTLLDRLIRGRIWIALIAFALIGIVTLQLLVLQLNAGIGRALVREAQLQRENAAYSVEDSELASGERVESQAARMGMALVPVGALRFLTSDPRADIARAAADLNTPVHGAGEQSTTASSAGAAASTATTGASGEQTPSGEQATRGEQPATGEQTTSAQQAQSSAQTPASESTAAAQTQRAAGPTGETAAAGTPSTPASAPVSPSGGIESTGAG